MPENGVTNKYASTGYWAQDVVDATNAGMFYFPQVYPGFSWDNLQQLAPGTSKIDRLGGNFLWKQFYDVASLGLDMAFVGMFDEVDEGTAIFKVSNTPPVQGYFMTYDGLPADWYLRLVAEGLKSSVANARTQQPFHHAVKSWQNHLERMATLPGIEPGLPP